MAGLHAYLMVAISRPTSFGEDRKKIAKSYVSRDVVGHENPQ